MTDTENPDAPSSGDGEGPDPGQTRTTNLAAVAAAIIVIGLVAFALYRRAHPGPAPVEEAGGEASSSPAPGTPITAIVPYHLSPEASIVAERYRCVCGCAELLNVCTCSKTPGSNDMKRTLQDLVNRRLAPEQIDQEMSGRFGAGVLLANAAPAAKPAVTPKPPAPRSNATKRRHP